MHRFGHFLFFAGVAIMVICGLLLSLDPGFVCRLEPDTPPQTPWSYPALCFITWSYSVPLGVILAAGGIIALSGATSRLTWTFLGGMLATYLFISFANGPMPHVPPLFGLGGALILTFYCLILWANRDRVARNAPKLAGYTFLVIGLWFTCGLGSRAYQPAMASGESPIDIMSYFVLAMGFFWLGEHRRARRRASDIAGTGLPAAAE